MPSPAQVREAVQRGSDNFPTHFPDDEYGHSFPTSILQASLQNGEVIQRDWLAWSKTKKALFCFPCRLFSKLPSGNRSFLTCASGYSTCQRWKKLQFLNIQVATITKCATFSGAIWRKAYSVTPPWTSTYCTTSGVRQLTGNRYCIEF